jgi:hypothetical protein
MATRDLAVAAFKADPTDAYWARRVCEEAGGRSTDEQLFARALACVVCKDPYNVVEESRLAVAHRLGLYGCGERTLRAVERRIKLEDASLAAHVKGKLWVAATSAMRDRAMQERFARRAHSHLRKVRPEQRSATFLEVFCHACAWVDYAGLLAHFDRFFELRKSYEKSSALVLMLSTAARRADWNTYARYRESYSNLPPDAVRAHDDCTVLNLDGLRALAERDIEGVARVTKTLIERARNVAFIGGPDTLTLANRLIRRRLFLDDVKKYLLMASDGGTRIPPTFTKAMRALVAKRHG